MFLRTRLAINELKHLPFFSRTFRNSLVSLLSDEEVSLNALYETISSDAGLTEKVLRTANSPYYGLSGRIADLKYALLLLGHKEVGRLIFSMMTERFFRNERNSKEISAQLTHNLKVAVMSSLITEIVPILTPREAHVCGLLHDIGRLIFYRIDHENYKTVSVSRDMLILEAEQFGCTHEEAGAFFLRDSQLPLWIVEAVRHHHSPLDAKEEYRYEVIMIAVAEWLLWKSDPTDERDSFIDDSDIDRLKAEITIGDKETKLILQRYKKQAKADKSAIISFR